LQLQNLLVPDLPLPLVEDAPDFLVKLVHFLCDAGTGLLADIAQRLDVLSDNRLNLRLLGVSKLQCVLQSSNHLLIDGFEADKEVSLPTANCHQGQPGTNDNAGYQNDKPEEGQFPAMGTP
jgi:hypothetical protein